MESNLDPTKSVLYAQVRNAGHTHGHDEEGNLRTRIHPANISAVYLGDVAQTLLKVLQGSSTPVMAQKPGFNEQRWEFTTRAGDISLSVESYSYWGFGLIAKCYANTLTLKGPLAERSRIIFDLVAALPHKPWELAWRRPFNSKIGDSVQNETLWMLHLEKAREDLNEMIELTRTEKGDTVEIEIARNALADDNAPAVLRSLARIEAESIEIEVEEISPDGLTLVLDDDEIPFVDLSSEEE